MWRPYVVPQAELSRRRQEAVLAAPPTAVPTGVGKHDHRSDECVAGNRGYRLCHTKVSTGERQGQSYVTIRIALGSK